MKQSILRSSSLFATIFFLTSMNFSTTVIKNPNTQKSFNDFFAKRSFVYSNITELEIKYKTTFNFFQKFKINQAKKKMSKELREENLLEECDSIKLKSGEVILAVVNEIGTSEIKYKKCENKNGPTYSFKKSEIAMIRYANGSSDFFGNENPAGENKDDLLNSPNAKTDGMAIASVAAVGLGITLALITGGAGFLLLIPLGILLAFVSKNKIKKSNGKLKGNGLATTAIVSGITIAVLMIVGTIVFLTQGF